MLIAVSVKKTSLHTVTRLVSDKTGEAWLHFNKNDQSKSYLIKESEVSDD